MSYRIWMSCRCGRHEIQIHTEIDYVSRLNKVSSALTAIKLEPMVRAQFE